MTALGFIVNISKSVLTPLDFLDFTISTSMMTIMLPQDKTAEIQKETSQFLQRVSVIMRKLACLVREAELFLLHPEARGYSHDNIKCFSTGMRSSLSGDHWRVVDIEGSLFLHQSLEVKGSLLVFSAS